MAYEPLEESEQIISVLETLINTIPDLPAQIAVEVLGDTPPSMALRQLEGAVKSKQNIDGGFTASFPFAIDFRVATTGGHSAIEATSTLNNIGLFFEDCTQSHDLPVLENGRELTKITISSFPNLVEKLGNGDEVYQAVYMAEYKQGGLT
jgi:hypothetical protein